jgi:hypothetical protein
MDMGDRSGRLPLIHLGAFAALVAVILAGVHIYSASVALVEVSGSGPGGETVQAFTVDGDWDLRWLYDCSSSLGDQYPKLDQCDFSVAVKQLSDCRVSSQNLGVTRHGPKNQGVVHNHAAGTFYLVVDAYGSWRVAVAGSGHTVVGPSPRCSEG